MTIEAVSCPQCGGALHEVTQNGFYTCPYCKARIRVAFYEPDPNRRPDGRTTIYDSNSGQELCYIKLARGWTASGSITNDLQSANWPFSLHVHAASPDRSALLYYRSGASFKEVIASSVMRHNEGGFDQSELMPMRRLQSYEQYADGFMAGDLPAGTRFDFKETRLLPKIPPENFEAKRTELAQSTTGQLRALTPLGMRSSVDNVIYQGATRIYTVEQNGQTIRQAVAVIVSGVQISYGAPMMLFGGTTTTILWDVPYVLTLKAHAAVFESNYDNLVMFCSSMQASPALFSQMAQERNRILANMGRQQSDNFQAHQQIMREQQAGFDAYNQAWHARSNHAHQAAHQRGAGQSAADRMSDMQSEGTRGVNTYIRPDGTEVEYSVVNEAAYANVNDSRDTFATQSKDFESADWVEMKKKY